MMFLKTNYIFFYYYKSSVVENSLSPISYFNSVKINLYQKQFLSYRGIHERVREMSSQLFVGIGIDI